MIDFPQIKRKGVEVISSINRMFAVPENSRAPARETPAEVQNGLVDIQKTEDGEAVLVLSGIIDKDVCEDITEKALMEIREEAVTHLVFEMKQVTYISRAGLTMFSKLNLQAGEMEKGYQLRNLRADIAEMFQMMGYAAAFSITVAAEEE